MERTNILKFKNKVQAIYYQTTKDELGIELATSPKRITLNEAKEILNQRNLEYDEVLRVKYEYVNVKIPTEEFKNYII